MWPKKIKLTKLETLSSAKYPQEHKYPSLTTVREGLMWEADKPEIGKAFLVRTSKTSSIFYTSAIAQIEKKGKNKLILTTLNSKYELSWTQ